VVVPIGPTGGKLRPDLIRVDSISVLTSGTGIQVKMAFQVIISPLKSKIIPVLRKVGNWL
jgi:hypothetical protein